MKTYYRLKVLVYTGSINNAGTDADVHIKVSDNANVVREFQLTHENCIESTNSKNPKNADLFEKGHCDVFVAERSISSLGGIKNISIKVSSNKNPEWFLDYVVVEKEYVDVNDSVISKIGDDENEWNALKWVELDRTVFPCFKWFEKGEIGNYILFYPAYLFRVDFQLCDEKNVGIEENDSVSMDISYRDNQSYSGTAGCCRNRIVSITDVMGKLYNYKGSLSRKSVGSFYFYIPQTWCCSLKISSGERSYYPVGFKWDDISVFMRCVHRQNTTSKLNPKIQAVKIVNINTESHYDAVEYYRASTSGFSIDGDGNNFNVV